MFMFLPAHLFRFNFEASKWNLEKTSKFPYYSVSQMIAPFYLCKNWLAAGLIIKLHNTVGAPDVHAHFPSLIVVIGQNCGVFFFFTWNMIGWSGEQSNDFIQSRPIDRRMISLIVGRTVVAGKSMIKDEYCYICGVYCSIFIYHYSSTYVTT